MPVIYEPSGKAREYSPLACNLYLSCTHMLQVLLRALCVAEESGYIFLQTKPTTQHSKGFISPGARAHGEEEKSPHI